MPLTREMMREGGRLAFKELKEKYPLYSVKAEGNITTLSLFGDTYKFVIDGDRKIAWMKSKHHYQASSNFKLATRHKDWAGIFSFPRDVISRVIGKDLADKEIKLVSKADHERLGVEMRIVANQTYKADKNKMARIFGGVLWKHLDRENACLAMKVYGLTASALDYSLIGNNKEEFLDTMKKAPSVLPVWRNIALVKMYKEKIKRPKLPAPPVEEDSFSALLSGLAYRKASNVDEVINEEHPGHLASTFNYPEDAVSFVLPDIIKTVKEHLDSRGLTNSGWRYLLKLPSRSVQSLMHGTGGRDFVALINWLAHIGIVPRYSLIKPLMKHILMLHERSENLTSFLRAALLKAEKMRGVRKFYDNEVQLAIDWFQRSGERHAVPVNKLFVKASGAVCGNNDDNFEIYHHSTQVELDNNQRRAGWDWFMRKQAEWHREAAQREALRVVEEAARLKKDTKDISWDSALGEFEYKNYLVVPLTNAHALIDEGKEMHHCVSSYYRDCDQGFSRIFAIRGKDRSKIATLEIQRSRVLNAAIDVYWEVRQCRGACNEEVSKEVKAVAEEIAKRYTIADNEQLKEKAIAI